MATTSTTTTNGRATRKSLAEQIDRLDTLLEGLSENLNEAVADAVKDTVLKVVREAVQAAVREVLTNAELQQRLQANLNPKPMKEPRWSVTQTVVSWTAWLASMAGGVWQTVAKTACWCWEGAKGVTKEACKEARQGTSAVGEWLKRHCRTLWLLLNALAFVAWQLRKPLFVALSVGVLVGVGCYFAGPVVGSLISGLAGFVGSLATFALGALHRMLVRVNMINA